MHDGWLLGMKVLHPVGCAECLHATRAFKSACRRVTCAALGACKQRQMLLHSPAAGVVPMSTAPQQMHHAWLSPRRPTAIPGGKTLQDGSPRHAAGDGSHVHNTAPQAAQVADAAASILASPLTTAAVHTTAERRTADDGRRARAYAQDGCTVEVPQRNKHARLLQGKRVDPT